MHTRLPSVLTCKRLVGSVKQRTTSPRKNLLFFCLTSLFANLLARIPSVCHAAQICKPPSQSKKYLRPPLSERIFLLSRKFVRHFSTLHCLLPWLGKPPAHLPLHNNSLHNTLYKASAIYRLLSKNKNRGITIYLVTPLLFSFLFLNCQSLWKQERYSI